jgi:hypothetical protein
MNAKPIKRSGCRSNGNCWRCRGSGVQGHDEVRGRAAIIGPITCKPCGGAGICAGCRGSGRITLLTLQRKPFPW